MTGPDDPGEPGDPDANLSPSELETLPPTMGGATLPGTGPAAAQAPLEVTGLGRYVVLDRIGSGGMGEVFRAYDPDLDRVIVVKRILALVDSERNRARLLREAQAIAQLSHPNVVQVFDVGQEDGQVFIAMELVAGQDLRHWLREEQRPWREIVAVFLHAGEGLAAAHARGIVHRDFKPENVLVTPEGQAKVVDFGLAKPAERTSSSVYDGKLADNTSDSLVGDSGGVFSGSGSGSTSSGSEVHPITQLGRAVGTPAYMPPEQISSHPTDARADQFSFAVALYEALFGRLPFRGKDQASYGMNVLGGKMVAISRDTAVPRRLQLALAKALHADREDRFESMAPLLVELRYDPARRRRRIIRFSAAGLAGVALSAGVLFASGAHEDAKIRACDVRAQRIDSVWSPEVRTGLHAALAAVDRPFASTAAQRTVDRLDHLAQRWSGTVRNMCLSASTEQRARAMSLQEAQARCLERSLSRAGSLVAALGEASASLIERAPATVAKAQLSLDQCSDGKYLATLAADLDTNDADHEGVLAQVQQVLDALTLGQVQRGQELFAAIPREQDDATTWPAELRLRWGLANARLIEERGELTKAAREASTTMLAALGGSGAADAAELLVFVGRLRLEADDIDGAQQAARRRLELRQATEHRFSANVIEAMSGLAGAPTWRGDYGDALELSATAADLAREHLPPNNHQRLAIERDHGDALARLGRHEEAEAILTDVLERLRSTLGETHPTTLGALHTLASDRLVAGDASTALELFREYLAGCEADHFTAPVDRLVALANIGGAHALLEQLDEARQVLEQALDLANQADMTKTTTGHALVAQLAGVENRAGRPTRAIELFRQVLAGRKEAQTDQQRNGLMVRYGLG
ncbi:MAG: serine/threonine protein kinase, partial [Deltaproteobacteria bacterium]|nr:serine/threonine protein kinase [Deltaproteobacteria bacterium]